MFKTPCFVSHELDVRHSFPCLPVNVDVITFSMEEVFKEIEGSAEVVQWFGNWPSFHDAEILGITLDRSGPSFIKINTWKYSDKVDSSGYFISEKNCIITFELNGIVDLILEGFNGQNVINQLSLLKKDSLFKIILEDCFGLSGELSAQRVSVTFEPCE